MGQVMGVGGSVPTAVPATTTIPKNATTSNTANDTKTPPPLQESSSHRGETEDSCNDSVCSDKPKIAGANPAPDVTYAYMHSGCPLNRKEVGRASWAYLHTLAAFYPERPTQPEQDQMKGFLITYGQLYPCGYCADTTSDEMRRHPPRTENRAELSRWMCELHNEVNDRLGKPTFDCDIALTRWREGEEGRCR